MIKEIVINSIGMYIDKALQLCKEENGKFKRFNYVFRGQNDEEYKLTSSLKRNYDIRSNYVEKRLLENFKKYYATTNSEISDSIWKNMSVAQHHGIPTRFLDFSCSPLIALHFALTDNKKNRNAVVWAINIEIVHNQLIPKKYRKKLNDYNAFSFSIEMLDELGITIEKYNYDMKKSGFIFLEPIAVDARITNQWSIFAILPEKLDPLDNLLHNSKFKELAYKFIIPSNEISTMRNQLDSMGINERVLFPDIDGLASYLKRRYMSN